MDEATLSALPEVESYSKFGNIKVEVDGEKFDSQGEYRHWILLKDREARGEIKNLRRQVPFTFGCGCSGEIPKLKYIADFVFDEKQGNGYWIEVVSDFKGILTAEYKLKKKLMKHFHGIDIRETKAR